MTRCRRAFTLIEAAVAVAIVAIALAATMTAIGASRVDQYRAGRLRQAHALADDLMAEILRQPYEEYLGAPLGADGGSEWLFGRTNYDDVDDYNGWAGSPPEDAAGNELTTFSRYTRRATVDYVSPANPAMTLPVDMGIKRIVVDVDFDGNNLVTLTAIRARGRDNLEAP